MTKATETPCTFISPEATSSIAKFLGRVSSSTSVTATTYTLATSTAFDATTTIISYFGGGINQYGGTSTVPTASQTVLVYQPGASSSEAIVPPNTKINLGVQGGSGKFGTTAQVGGSCELQLDWVL